MTACSDVAIHVFEKLANRDGTSTEDVGHVRDLYGYGWPAGTAASPLPSDCMLSQTGAG